MFHFFVKQDQIEEERICITGADVNHMKNVLRMKQGEEILISDGEGKDYYCKVHKLEKDQVIASIISKGSSETELPAKLVLFQGLPKGDKMEFIIQKAVELGVWEIVPVSTKYTVVKLDGKKEENRLKRWNAIAESAAKQSKRGLIPKVREIMTLDQALSYSQTFDMAIIPYEEARGMETAKQAVSAVKPGMKAGIFIGPEGGFAKEEIKAAVDHGAMPVSLGKRILRTETAGLAVLSVLMFALEE
ncbi:16S rRNA (uracil(1498)-N(3))-methyltransferase [Lachnoclostridium edouardi]|uniref:16S rRNA (uracil(1498)-N(3))-methyltransferase n=1 Tax=Lachnoclostridium edouardi TaxID=1926283 RepID=UPI000C7A7E3F|nr:16S rRNA (uracil(1498)-N(3))-methyltransferase [Lachnoclostridium edouardi]